MNAPGRPAPTRLYVLGLLLHGGPMHGHQILREARIQHADNWAEIRVGSLYGALHRLEAEGLVRAVRSEREGRFPARTVYAITDEGRREFHVLRETALQAVRMPPDAFDLALAMSDDLVPAQLGPIVQERIAALEALRRANARLRDEARPWLRARELLGLRHAELRLEVEIRWHRELLADLPVAEAGEGDESPPGGPGTGEGRTGHETR